MLALMTGKILFIVFCFFLTLFCALFPFAIKKFLKNKSTSTADATTGLFSNRKDLIETILNCFSAGVFLGTAFLHLIPECSEHYTEVDAYGFIMELADNETIARLEDHVHEDHEHGHSHELPVAFLLILCGFFMVYLMETLLDFLITACQKKKDLGKVKDAPREMSENSLNGHLEVDPAIGQYHGHSHGGKPKATLFDAVTLVVALSIHSVLEGITIGISLSNVAFAARVISISLHKLFVAMITGNQVARACKGKPITMAILLLIFSSATPLGVSIGTILTESNRSLLMAPANQLVIVVLEAVSAGMFVYIAFFELLMKEQVHHQWGVIQAVSCSVGAATLTGILAVFH